MDVKIAIDTYFKDQKYKVICDKYPVTVECNGDIYNICDEKSLIFVLKNTIEARVGSLLELTGLEWVASFLDIPDRMLLDWADTILEPEDGIDKLCIDNTTYVFVKNAKWWTF